MSVVFELFKNVVLDTEKRSAIIFGKAITPNVFEKKKHLTFSEKGQKIPNKFENTQQSPRITEEIIVLAQPKIKLHSCKR